jgi:hypothetical protein
MTPSRGGVRGGTVQEAEPWLLSIKFVKSSATSSSTSTDSGFDPSLAASQRSSWPQVQIPSGEHQFTPSPIHYVHCRTWSPCF